MNKLIQLHIILIKFLRLIKRSIKYKTINFESTLNICYETYLMYGIETSFIAIS